MAGFMPDTNCLVAVVSVWHEHHAPAITEFRRGLGGGEPLLLAGPSLVETYSVLTRLPKRVRVSPPEALALLEANFLTVGTLIALGAEAYAAVVREAATDGVAGGRIYNMEIASCALRAGAATLLTVNEVHFREFARWGLRIVVPQVDRR